MKFRLQTTRKKDTKPMKNVYVYVLFYWFFIRILCACMPVSSLSTHWFEFLN